MRFLSQNAVRTGRLVAAYSAAGSQAGGAARAASTSPPSARKSSKVPLVASIAVAAVAGLAYSEGPTKPTIAAPDEEKLQRARIAHWRAWKAKREEIELRHALLAKKELDDLEREHPGAMERRKECEARRAEIKEKEMKLVKDRHASTEPGMNAGRIPGWADQQALRREHERAFDLEMEALDKKLGPAVKV